MHADPLDFAAELEERERAHAATIRKPVLTHTQKCHACEALVAAQALFCDDECRADWERVARSQRIKGQRS